MPESRVRTARPRATGPTGLPSMLVVALAVAIVCTLYSVRFFLTVLGGPDRNVIDFGTFYASGRAALEGQSAYATWPGNENMNPPILTNTVFPLLARLSPTQAAVVWTLAGIIGLACSIRELSRDGHLSAQTTAWAAALLLISFPAQIVWQRGQVTWLLLYPMTRAWIAYRKRQPYIAGAWLAPVIAVKPILALMPFCLGWTLLWISGLGSLLLTAIGIGITGWREWADWIAAVSQVVWYAWPLNASIWSVGVRAVGVQAMERTTLAILPPAWILVAVLVGLALVLTAWRVRADPDRRWVISGIFALALAPLGWIYYLPLFMGALAILLTARAPSPLLWIGVLCQMVPIPVFRAVAETSPWLFVTLGSLYWWGLVSLWIGVLRTPQTASGTVDDYICSRAGKAPTPRLGNRG